MYGQPDFFYISSVISSPYKLRCALPRCPGGSCRRTSSRFHGNWPVRNNRAYRLRESLRFPQKDFFSCFPMPFVGLNTVNETDDDDGGSQIGQFHRETDAQVIRCAITSRAVHQQIEGCADRSQEGSIHRQ